MRQLKDLMQSPAEGIRVRVNEENVTDILAELDESAGPPLKGGAGQDEADVTGGLSEQSAEGVLHDENFFIQTFVSRAERFV